MPADGLPLYKVNLSAENTAESNSKGGNVNLTDIRRMEVNSPRYFVSAIWLMPTNTRM